jgi:hypothetical protein
MRVQLLGIISANALAISQAMAQQPVGQPLAAPLLIVGRTAATIVAEGQRTGVLQRYQDDRHELIAEYEYYLWREACYIRQPSGTFYSVPSESCR